MKAHTVILCVILSALAVFLEALTRLTGVPVPFCAIMVFYLTFLHGLRAAVPAAFVMGFVLDSIFGYPQIILPFSLAAVTLIAFLWRDFVQSGNIFFVTAPGAIFPLLVFLPHLLVRGNLAVGLEFLPNLFVSMLLSAVFTPLCVSAMDVLRGWMGMDQLLGMSRKNKGA